MQNIDVRFSATSNFSKVQGDLKALQAQAAALGAVFDRSAYAQMPMAVDPKRWQSSTRAVHEASNAFRQAASSSGLFNTQQIRATSEAERYTKALQKQKLSITDMLKHRGIMNEVYRDQLRMQRMTAQYWGTDGAGKAVTDIAVPKNVPRDLDTMGQRMRFFSDMTKSAGANMIDLGKNVQWAGRQLMVGFTYPLVLFGAGAGLAAYQVEDAFGKINKVYDVSAKALNNEAQRTKELNAVRVESMTMAKQVAEDYGITINKTLAVEQALAATGLTATNGLIEATKEVQRISALGDIDPEMTTDMVVALQNAFKLDPTELTNALNFMNATSNVTSLSLQDIAEATPRAASGLAGLGVSVEEMTILLVSMKENGVQAAEAANALKSATTRILNPVSKASAYYKEYGINLQNLSKQSGGNIYKFIKLLGKEQELIIGNSDKETARLRARGVAALFGTYQYNRLFASLTNVNDATTKGGNQTEKAMELQKKSNKEITNMAEISEKLMMETPAAKMRKEWAKFHAELSEMGKPFLEAATQVLKAFGSIAKAFNGMDDWKKKLVMITAILAGLAGPAIMLTGLFMNLFGHMVKGFGAGIGIMSRFMGAQKLVNKEEQAATLTAEAQNKALMATQTTTSTLAHEVQVLAAAYAEATAAARAFAEVQGISAGRPGGVPFGPQPRPQTWTPSSPQQQFMGMPGGLTQMPTQKSNYTATRASEKAIFAQRVESAKAVSSLERQRLHAQTELSRKALAENKIRQNIQNKVTTTSVGMTAMSVAMGAMLVGGDSFIGQIGKWALIGTIVVPAVKAVSAWTAVAAKNAAAFAAAQNAAAAAAWRTAGAAGLMGSTKAGIGGLLAGFAGTGSKAGPIGLAITAVGVATYGLYKATKESREEWEEQQRVIQQTQADVLDVTEAWAENTGKAWKNYKRYNQEGLIDLNRKKATAYDKAYEFYQTPKEEGGTAETVDAFKDLGDAEKSYTLVSMLVEMIDMMGLKTRDAKIQLAAFLDAAGVDMFEAADMIDSAFIRLGQIESKAKLGDRVNWSNFMNRGLNTAFANIDTKFGTKAGEDAGKAFQNGFLQADDKGDYIEKWHQKFLGKWESKQNEIKAWFEQRGGMTKVFTEAGLNRDQVDAAVKKFQYYLDNANIEDFRTEMFQGGLFESVSGLEFDASGLIGLERAFFGAAAQARGMASEVDTMNDFLNQTQILAETMSKPQKDVFMKDAYDQVIALERRLADIDPEDPMEKAMIPGIKKAQRELIRMMQIMAASENIKPGRSAVQAFSNWYYNIQRAEDAAKDVKDAIDDIPTRKNVTIQIDQVGGIVQNAMGNVQDLMAESAMNQFNSNWDNRIAGVQASQEAASNALDRQQQNAQDAFDARWERRREAVERAYQERIDRINKEIEAEQKANDIRQKLFEKEMERLRRLAERMNTNIDFNVAVDTGDLDEAAKIYNNAQANSLVQQMEDEQRVAEARAEARINTLEKKNERLEKQRDKELKQLQKMEDRMRKHLERVQDARRGALEAQQEDVMNSLDQQRNYEEAVLEQRLTLFKAYTARNQKDLERWMKEVGLSYDDFGSDVKAKGEAWSSYFRKELAQQIRLAGTEVMNDNIWSEVGKKMAEKLLTGLGFKNLAEFNRFVRTGQRGGGDGAETNHGGGVVGAGGSGRGNIPEGRGGLHRSEMMVRAQKGEYIVNKKAAAKNMNWLRAINTGNRTEGVGRMTSREGWGPGRPNEGRGGPTSDLNGLGDRMHYGGPAAFVGGINTRLFGRGFQHAGENAYQVGAQKEQARLARQRARDRRRNNTPGGKNVNIPEGTDPRGARAIEWASSMIGTTGWYNRCLSFVRQAFGHPGGVASATDSWNMASNKYSTSGGVPAGVPVFWTTGQYGHVALSTGRGGLISTDHPVYNSAGKTTIASVSSWLGANPAGWSNEINGMPIYPALRKGGTLRSDSLINAHKGETVLPASLTEKFKENVKTGGGGDTLHVTLDLRGATIREDIDIKKAVYAAIDEKEAKLGRKRVVR